MLMGRAMQTTASCARRHPVGHHYRRRGADTAGKKTLKGAVTDRGDSGFEPALDSSDYGHDIADRDEYNSLPGRICPSDSGDDGDHFGDDFDVSIPDLESASDSDSDDDGDDFDGSIPDLESASDSDSDGMSDFCGSIPDLDSGSDSGDDGDYFDDHRGDDFGDSIPDLDSSSDSYDDIDPLPCDFWAYDYDTEVCETFRVVQSQSVSSSGNGFVTFAKKDVKSGRMIGLQLLGTHCMPGQPFNLLSVVALEDAGFLVDFGARTMWPLAARHDVYILNRIFRKSLGWTSTYYRIQKKHADLSQLRVFGCRAYPFIDPTVREHKLSDRARELRYVGHFEVSSAYLLYDHESGKVVNFGMVTFSKRLDKLGKVVTTWDPSAVTPFKTNFMATAPDAPYRDPPPALLEVVVLEQGVYLPEDGDEVMAVVKVENSDGMCWVELEAQVQIKRALLMMKEEDVPAGVKLLDMSLILKVKLDKHRQLLKRKSRICVRGNKQEYGVDYYDTFAPCTQLSSVQIVIILALNLGLVVYHMDVDTVFLNSVLEEDLYDAEERCGAVSVLHPGLAGIMVITVAYVDDYLVATNDKSWYDTFVTTFHSQYACKDLGVLNLSMSIGVRWGDDTTYLSQSGYISQMISTYGLDDAKPATLPMSLGAALSPGDGKDLSLHYRALLGQLQWVACCSRPDIIAVVSVLSRFCTTYGPEHFVALKQVVRYLKGTREYELVLRTASAPGGCGTRPSRPLPLSIYTDADYAGCKTFRRSTFGIAVFLCGSVVIFSSMIQKCVSLSTTEAEIIDMSEGAREVKYVLNVLDSLVDICRPVPMYCDNQGAIHLASDYVNSSRSKHIEVRNMYIQELIKAKETEALYTAWRVDASQRCAFSERHLSRPEGNTSVQALAEKLGYAADSTQDLLGSKWQIEMDIGREKGTWMPPGWAASGRRVVLPIAIELQ
eukprot:gene26901-biopygen27858